MASKGTPGSPHPMSNGGLPPQPSNGQRGPPSSYGGARITNGVASHLPVSMTYTGPATTFINVFERPGEYNIQFQFQGREREMQRQLALAGTTTSSSSQTETPNQSNGIYHGRAFNRTQ